MLSIEGIFECMPSNTIWSRTGTSWDYSHDRNRYDKLKVIKTAAWNFLQDVILPDEH